ncbi:MAG: FHA domain-containing protein [Opitutaceae bacterium]|nr:FHA domain-containing protein [Opitutaceae bacterium]
MIKSRSKFFLYAKVAQAEPGDETFDDAKAGHPVERRLNRIERVAATYHAQVDLRFERGRLVTFGSPDAVVLGACEMQQRCAVLPQVLRMKLALRIGIHQGMIRQRSEDVDDRAAEIATQLARINDGILITEELVHTLGKELHPFVRPYEETVAGAGALAFEWREIPQGAGAESLLSESKYSWRTGPYLQLQLGLKMLELSSEHNPVATIGRDPTSDFIIDDIHVSRNHCRIECTPKDILLTDSSTNGTIIVTENKQEILVKNSSATLSGRGMIFFGRPFMGDRRGGIRYESS